MPQRRRDRARDFGKSNAHGHGDALTEDNRLAIGEQRQIVEQIQRAIMRIGPHDLLVALGRKPHRNGGVALRQYGGVEIGWALC